MKYDSKKIVSKIEGLLAIVQDQKNTHSLNSLF